MTLLHGKTSSVCIFSALGAMLLVPIFLTDSSAGSIGVRPGSGPVIHKRVTSIKASRYRRVVPQELDFSCGAAALATVLKYHFGKDISEEAIVREMLKNGDRDLIKQKGFSLLDIKRHAEKMSFKAEGYRIRPEYLAALQPGIVMINTRGYSHFVVFKGVVGENVYLADPATGNRVMSLGDFMAAWNSIVLIIDGPKTGVPEGLYLSTTEAPGAEAIRTQKINLGFLKDPKEF